MTKSVVKAMDAVQEYSRDELKQPITRYVVTGASKRGWTSWLTAAVDRRVAGIIPMVYDNLNLPAQMPHQLESWGAYSEQIEDYTKRGLQAMMQTPRGQRLVQAVDPYTYRNRYTMPKLLINGSNDRYWPLDAFNLYRRDLPAPTQIFYAPNSGHGLGGNELRVAGTSVAWVRAWATGKALPSFNLRLSSAAAGGQAPVEIRPNQRYQLQLLVSDSESLTELGGLKAARVWIAHAPTRDFRAAKWQATVIVNPQEKFRGNRTPSISLPPMPEGTKFGAAFAEWEIASQPTPLTLSSPVVIWQSAS
jgi:PhoPQ-activated pathogenicity-related protein